MRIADALRLVPGETEEAVSAMLCKLAAIRFAADDPADGAFCCLSEAVLNSMGFDVREVCAIIAAQKMAEGEKQGERACRHGWVGRFSRLRGASGVACT